VGGRSPLACACNSRGTVYAAGCGGDICLPLPGFRCLGATFLVATLVVANQGAIAHGAVPRGWPTFGFDVRRTGANGWEQRLGPRAARTLVERWSTSIEGAINAQPVVALDVVRPGGRVNDLVFVGTEAGWLVALDMRSGRVVWRRSLGGSRPGPVHGCPAYPDQVFGVTGTPVIDRARGRIYAVGGGGRAFALRLGSGRIVRRWPVDVATQAGEHVWGATTLWRNVLYVGIASYCDQPPFRGGVVAVDTRRARRIARWRTTGRGAHAPFGGGVWGWGGVSVDPRDGNVYAATGNALTRRETDGAAERVVRLTRRLRVLESNHPFRRRTIGDQDFGSTPLLYRAAGCPPQVAALNKDGELFVYRRHRIARGPVQRLRIAQGSSEGNLALLGLPAYDASRRTLFVLTPSDSPDRRFRRGLLALRIGSRCRLSLAWQAPAGVTHLTSAPVVANGVVYFATGDSGEVRAVDAGSGRSLRTLSLGPTQAFAAPTVVAGGLIATGYDGRVHLYRPMNRSGILSSDP
jgi:outer membrane protein assembly factor BamB